MRLIHLADADNRDSNVQFVGIGSAPPPTRVASGKAVLFRRYLAASDNGTHEALQKAHGDDYGKALIEGDPEVDIESVGRAIGATNTVYLSASGEVLRVAPRIVEVLFGPDGAERERRDPVETPSNIQDATPVRWGKVRLKRKDAVRRLAFTRTVQLVHVDGLTYQYLHGLAKQLDEADEMVLIGAGTTGRDPLVFQVNGVPWRGFLEGRVDGPRYQLLLRLSNLELKAPEAKA
ncbi:MAG: hypothetical protein FJX55_18000 [Alphaproteobacteria bacterium]|nr:hypothetical protein [Alphaproteobacteria bacterium]